MSSIKYIKLSNGQELVGEVVSEKQGMDTSLELSSDAAVVFLARGEAGQAPMVNMAPFAPFTSENTIKVNRDQVVFVSDANDELQDFYKQATNKSKVIQQPKSKVKLN